MGQATSQAIIALGANLGDSASTLRAAAERIACIPGVSVSSASCIYRSEPAYLEEQADFYNAAMMVDCALEPLPLLHELQNIEQEFGRVRTVANGPRSLDLDIIDFAGVVCDSSELILPHPLALERGFVVEPLLELVPEYRLADGRSVTEANVKYGHIISKGEPLIERLRAVQTVSDELSSYAVQQPSGDRKYDIAGEGSGLLSICATPIGNLRDITLRVIDALKAADVILAEDTRVTRRLLNHLEIHTKLERCDENIIRQRIPSILEDLRQGRRIAFVSDAGTPGVADPGSQLIAAAQEAGLIVEVLPGASAVLTALVASGFTAPGFYFGGFLPRKESRLRELFDQLAALDASLVFYESPHRTAKSLQLIAQCFPEREVVMARELTKLFEEVLRGPAPEIAEQIAQRTQERALKGEVVLVIGPPEQQANNTRTHRDKYADKNA